MSEDGKKKTLFESVIRKILPLLFLQLGCSLGIFIGLLATFGFRYTVENFKLNPDTFAKQFAHCVFWNGWITVAVVVVIAVIVGIEWIGRRRRSSAV